MEISPKGLFPDIMTFWSGLSFYDFLVEECKLNQKVALMGVSRGGLFVYNWAKKNPDKVACIYAEAPVCDFKSWPSEFGKSEGSPADWERLKEEYGFISDDDAKQFADNPMDGLEVLAENKVPILHMIGLNDKIVPPDENTIPLINKFISIGGIATVVPCTKIGQKLKDHHFISKPSRLVADFIKYNTR